MKKRKCPICNNNYKKINGLNEIWYDCVSCNMTSEKIEKLFQSQAQRKDTTVSAAEGLDLSEDDNPRSITPDCDWGLL